MTTPLSPLSACCGAPVRGGFKGNDSWLFCKQCGKPCTLRASEPLSVCCNASIKTHYSYEGTGCWLCDKCGKACNVRTSEPTAETSNSAHGRVLPKNKADMAADSGAFTKFRRENGLDDPRMPTDEMEKLLQWVEKEIVEPFDEDEITGDHRIIVDLYNICRSLIQQSESERSLLRKGVEEQEIEIVEMMEELSWIQELSDSSGFTMEGCDSPEVRLAKIKACCDDFLSTRP